MLASYACFVHAESDFDPEVVHGNPLKNGLCKKRDDEDSKDVKKHSPPPSPVVTRRSKRRKEASDDDEEYMEEEEAEEAHKQTEPQPSEQQPPQRAREQVQQERQVEGDPSEAYVPISGFDDDPTSLFPGADVLPVPAGKIFRLSGSGTANSSSRLLLKSSGHIAVPSSALSNSDIVNAHEPGLAERSGVTIPIVPYAMGQVCPYTGGDYMSALEEIVTRSLARALVSK